LGIERNDNVLFLSQIETHHTIRAFFPPGSRNPMHSSGIGKALLAYYDAPRLKAIIDSAGLHRFTDKTITDPDLLTEELARIRRSGFAVDDEERTEGMRCIAAPVFNVHGEPFAGLSVSGPAFRIPMNATPELGRVVRKAAEALTLAIGGRLATAK
jgi:IclR family acetate operon transcriptional repressor